MQENSKEEKPTPESPWYKNGVRFGCTGCGKCCTGQPGYVWVSEKEIEAIAEHLKLSVKDFGMRFLRLVSGRHSLVEFKKNHDCVFLKEKQCSIYPVRPVQCRTFPFWKRTLSSPEAWATTAMDCEGINHPDAPLVPIEEIEKQLQLYP